MFLCFSICKLMFLTSMIRRAVSLNLIVHSVKLFLQCYADHTVHLFYLNEFILYNKLIGRISNFWLCGQCGFFKRKQREQLIRKKRESARLFAPEDDDDDVTGDTGNDVTGDDVTDKGRGLSADVDGVQDKHSVYDNDADAPW